MMDKYLAEFEIIKMRGDMLIEEANGKRELLQSNVLEYGDMILDYSKLMPWQFKKRAELRNKMQENSVAFEKLMAEVDDIMRQIAVETANLKKLDLGPYGH
jgi:hypothetical protein